MLRLGTQTGVWCVFLRTSVTKEDVWFLVLLKVTIRDNQIVLPPVSPVTIPVGGALDQMITSALDVLGTLNLKLLETEGTAIT